MPWERFCQLQLLPLLGVHFRQAEIALGGSGDELLAYKVPERAALKKPTYQAPERVAEFRPEHGFA